MFLKYKQTILHTYVCVIYCYILDIIINMPTHIAMLSADEFIVIYILFNLQLESDDISSLKTHQ